MKWGDVTMSKLPKPSIFSYTLGCEDVILYSMLGRRDVFWIDVGANHPIYGSVTKYFLGRGVNIEPLPYMFEKLVADRPNDINLNCAVGEVSGECRICVEGAYSKVVNDSSETANIITVPMMTLTEIAKKYDLPQDVHFCKIDVEGFEKSVLRGLDFNVLRPWLFCIESDKQSVKEWGDILLGNGYEYIGVFGANSYYADISKKKVLNTDNFENLLNDWHIYPTVNTRFVAITRWQRLLSLVIKVCAGLLGLSAKNEKYGRLLASHKGKRVMLDINIPSLHGKLDELI
jgi:FkbM family methyltransferase